MNTVFRPRFARPLAVACWLVLAWVLADALLAAPAGPVFAAAAQTWRLVATIVALMVLAWLMLWRPTLILTDAAAVLINPWRRAVVPLAAITATDTRYALTLSTATGRYRAWVAPAPGLREARRLSASETAAARRIAALGDGSVRPGDLPGSDAGTAAALVRGRLAAGAGESDGVIPLANSRWDLAPALVTALASLFLLITVLA